MSPTRPTSRARPRARARAGLALAAALAVGLAGPAAASTSSATASILRAGQITRADVPPTWSHSKQIDTLRSLPRVDACRPIAAASAAARRHLPRRLSATFIAPGSAGVTFAENTVYAFPSARAAAAYLSVFQAPGARTCFTAVFQHALAKLRATVTVVPVTTLAGSSDASVGYEGTLATHDAQGTPVTVVFDLAAVTVGRAFVGFDFSNVTVALPEGPALVQAVTARLRGTGA
jgi:hypothetical protein